MSDMADVFTPTLRGRRLALELRELRERSGLTQAEAASRAGVSKSKLSRIEDAKTRASDDDVAALLQMYGLDPDRHPAIRALNRDSWQRGWWTVYGDAFRDNFIMLEEQAPTIRTYETLLIPGLFQTPDYARTMFRNRRDLEDADLDRLVEARMHRKSILTRLKPPTVHVVINEAAFRERVGDAELMRKQASEVWSVASGHPGVTVQILPFGAAPPCALFGSFTLFEFGDHGLDVAHSEGPLGEWYAESNDQLTKARLSFEDVTRAALSPAQSIEWLEARTRE
jgi:transcriptional regulator with XRE-family HTH domain